jgi:hypothetical protein
MTGRRRQGEEGSEFSSWLHPDDVRRMWIESQRFELEVDSNSKQDPREGSNCRQQGHAPSRSARHLVLSFASLASVNVSAIYIYLATPDLSARKDGIPEDSPAGNITTGNLIIF